MITLVPDVKRLYEALRYPLHIQKEKDLAEELVREHLSGKDGVNVKTVEGTETPRPFMQFFSHGICLPSPFKEVSFTFFSNGLNYSIQEYFNVEGWESFLDCVKSHGSFDHQFLQMGEGAIFQRKDDPEVVATLLGQGSYLGSLVYGGNGTRKRSIHSLEIFEREIGEFCDLTQRIINAQFDGEVPRISYNLSLQYFKPRSQ